MNSRREFEIAFVGLKPGIHEFNYTIDDNFFEEYGEQDFKGCNAHVKLRIDKSSANFMILRFEVGGVAEVSCDRCSNELPFQLFDEFTVTVKLVDEPDLMNEQEEDPDVYYLSKGESHLDVKAWIFEFINLSLPMQRTCEFENMDGPHCNPAARAILKSSKENAAQENPIWKGLNKFKDLDN
ncbi:MAG TPA: DUF177 domain-containing protein [Chitinophagaceae bacterium]|jgi:uncharacterized metal-binding protein YceD (DUF177 family)|nr:DUF177 domain-containing protein [Chitinophagaceae bacterium]